jgi:hypothetical protein
MKRQRNRAVLALGLASCMLFFAGTDNLYGQTASISGRVSDPTGAAIPDAQVTIKNTGTSATQNTTTDGQGRYTEADLTIGTYDISASKTSF